MRNREKNILQTLLLLMIVHDGKLFENSTAALSDVTYLVLFSPFFIIYLLLLYSL